MRLSDGTLKEYDRLTLPGTRMLSRNEYIKIIRQLIEAIDSMQLEIDDLKADLENEQYRRRKLQEANDGQ